MSQAEELLASLSEEDISAYTADQSTEEHIIIGDNRIITVPSSLKRIAVQHDNNIETVTFDCPRYWDEHDMSKMKVYINYLRADRKPGCYPIDTGVTVDAENDKIMHFNWKISNNVTEVHGKIVFLVCIKTVDEVGNEAEHWNSELCTDMYVSEGLETQETVIEKYPDLITHLLTRMDIVEDKTTLESMLGYLDTYFTTDAEINEVLKNYVETYLSTDDAATQKIADTINTYIQEHLQTTDPTLTIEGGIADAAATGDAVRNMVNVSNDILIDDSVEGVLNFKKLYGRSEQKQYSGKNLLNSNNFTARTVNGITFTPVFYDNGLLHHIIVNGTATETLIHLVGTIVLIAATSYNLSGCPTTGSNDTYGLTLRNSSGATVYTTEYGASADYTAVENITVYCYIRIAAGATVSNLKFYPMVRLTSISDATYEPYTGGMAAPNPEYPQDINSAGDGGVIEGEVYSGNLLNMDEVYSKLGSNSEITQSYSNGKLTMSGTPTATYRQNTTGRTGLKLPVGVAGKTLYFGATLTGNQPYMVLYVRDSSGAQLEGGCGLTASGVKEVNIPENAAYIEFAFCLNMGTTGTAYTATYSDLYLSTANNGYTEYADPKSITIPTPNGLPGIEVSEGNWVCDEIDVERGVYVKRIGEVVLDGSEDELWKTDSTNTFRVRTTLLSSIIKATPTNETLANILCNAFIATTASLTYLAHEGISIDKYGAIYIKYNNVSSLAEWTEWLAENPITVVYELATPIETPLTREQLLAFRNYSSHDGGTNILFDPIAPGVEVEYPRTLAASHVLENQKNVDDLMTPIREVSGVGDITIDDSVAGGLRVTKMVGKSVQETVPGNQLLPYPFLETTKTVNGITFTDNGDGTITANGTATNAATLELYNNASAPITANYISGLTVDGSDKFFVRASNIVDNSATAWNVGYYDTSAFEVKQVYIRILSGVTVNNAVFKPMLSNTECEWEPYVGGIPSPNPEYPQPIVSVGEKLAMGKNLLENTLTTRTSNGVTFKTNADGTVTANGTANVDVVCKIGTISQLPKGDYIGNGCPSGGSTSTYFVTIYKVVDGANSTLASLTGKDASFSLTEPTEVLYIVRIANGTTVSNLTFKPMIRLASITDGTYEPYTGGKKAAFDVGIGNDICGKNLLKNTAKNESGNGLTSTVNKDGSVTVNGTATKTTFLNIARVNLKANETYYLKCGDIKINGFGIKFSKANISYDITGSAYTPIEDIEELITLRIEEGFTVNTTVYPMLNLGSEPLSWEPYTEQSHTLNRTLRAIPVTDESLATYTDADGQMWVADTIEEVDGKMCLVERVYEEVFDGTKSCDPAVNTSGETKYVVDFGATAKMAIGNGQSGLCDKFISYGEKVDNSIRFGANNNSIYLYTDDDRFATTESTNAFFASNPMTMVYPLATPVITELTNDEIIALRSLKSHDGITHIFTDNNPASELTVSYGATELGGLALENKNLHEVNTTLVNDKYRIRTYYKLDHIGLDPATADIPMVVEAMADNSIGLFSVGSGYSTSLCPDNTLVNGLITINKVSNYRTDLRFKASSTNVEWTGSYYNGTWSGWSRVITEADYSLSADGTSLVLNWL